MATETKKTEVTKTSDPYEEKTVRRETKEVKKDEPREIIETEEIIEEEDD